MRSSRHHQAVYALGFDFGDSTPGEDGGWAACVV